MPRTPLASLLRRAYSVATESEQRDVSVDQVIEEHATRPLSRRGFLRQIGAAAAIAVLPMPRMGDPTAPSVAIVGAGLAGLTCAYRLRQAGIIATVYEASSRLGGRCWSDRTTFADKQITEHGGELIDTGHTAIRGLAKELGLPLDDLLKSEQRGSEPLYFFDGAPYSYAQAATDFRAIWKQIQDDSNAADYPTLYSSYTPRGQALDQMSISDWINSYVPGGKSSRLGKLLDVAYTIEYGAETSEQSALNMLYLIGDSPRDKLSLFGESDERFHVRGGNDQIVSRLAAKLEGQITTSAALTAIRKASDGRYTLSIQRDSGTSDVSADYVVLALPFSVLRATVDLSRAGFSQRKQTAIQELGMGTNTKLNLQFNRRLWRELGFNGDTFADTGYQASWEVTRAQAGASGILVDFTGGTIGASFNTGTPNERAQQFLSQLEPVFPGISATWNGRASIDYWSDYRWSRGSYSFWKVGQYTRFAGVEGEREGTCLFAGEHTSVDAQGYLEGAVESGERAASEIAG